MASDDCHRDLLEEKRLEIVKSVNCERTLLLDHLRSNRHFDQSDCELIRAETTNDARVGKLIDFLLLKGPDAFQCFIDVMQIENPTLYESLTGAKANSTVSPLMRQFAFPEIRPGEVSQLQPLVEYQERILKDLSESTKRYRDVLKANESLESKLENAIKDLEFEKTKRKHYENRLSQERTFDESLLQNELLLCHEYDEMEKGIADRDVYIIVLQMKLLAEKEEVEKLKKMLEELQHKNEKMSRELRRVSQSYNQERCQSLKLSECIRLQGDELQKIDELRKELRESKYKNMIVMEERDAKIDELNELKKWAEALKTRFDVVEKEKQTSLEKTEVVSNNCAFLQETVRTLNQKLSTTNLELEEMKKRYELVVKDCDLFKTQRNHALEARREAVNTRDAVSAEKDCLQAQYNELLAKREQMNEERAHLIQTYDSLYARHEKSSEELIRLKTALNEKELEVEDLVRSLKLANDKNNRNSKLLDKLPGLSESSNEDDYNDDVTSDTGERTTDASEGAVAGEETLGQKQPWRERRMKSLLNSIKYRISGDRADDARPREAVSLVASNVTLEVLKHLLPNLSTRPCSTVDNGQMQALSRTWKRHVCLKKKVDSTLKKERSKTAPCSLVNLPSFFNFEDEPCEEGLKSTNSTPDLMYPEDINVVPQRFRSRSRNMIGKNAPTFQRANSAQ